MKALIFSDSHGNMENIREALTRNKNIDMVVHLGDILHQDDELRAMVEVPLVLVKGNCDFYLDAPTATVFNLGPKKIFATHGHLYGVKYGYDRVYYAGYEQKADIVLFGHTHEAMVSDEGRVALFNPGSISMPRRYDDKPSYGIIEIDDDGNCEYTIKTV